MTKNRQEELEKELAEVVATIKRAILLVGIDLYVDTELEKIKRYTNDIEYQIKYMKFTFNYEQQLRMIKVWEHLEIGDFKPENTLETLI